MTHPFWKKHNLDSATVTFLTWAVGLGLVLLYQLLMKGYQFLTKV